MNRSVQYSQMERTCKDYLNRSVFYASYLSMERPKGFKREEVLDRAVQLFWRKGYAETSLQDLEKATGVNKSGLYSEFRDKDDLFVECLNRYGNTNGIMEILGQKPLGRKNLESFLLAGQRCKEVRGCFIANTIREFSIAPPKAKTQIVRHLGKIREAVATNVESVESANHSSLLTDLILTFNSGIALRLNVGEIDGLDKQVKEFLDRIFRIKIK